jgi:hypothetical protein
MWEGLNSVQEDEGEGEGIDIRLAAFSLGKREIKRDFSLNVRDSLIRRPI